MVISITLTYRVALLERAAKGVFVRRTLYRDAPRNFSTLFRMISPTAYIRGGTSGKHAEIQTVPTFKEIRSRIAEIAPLERGARGAPQTTVFFFLLFYADRKGKLNSPTASAEILSFASERILQRGERDGERRKAKNGCEKRGRSLGFVHERQKRGSGGEKKKKRCKRNFQCVWILTGGTTFENIRWIRGGRDASE